MVQSSPTKDWTVQSSLFNSLQKRPRSGPDRTVASLLLHGFVLRLDEWVAFLWYGDEVFERLRFWILFSPGIVHCYGADVGDSSGDPLSSQ